MPLSTMTAAPARANQLLELVDRVSVKPAPDREPVREAAAPGQKPMADRKPAPGPIARFCHGLSPSSFRA